MRSKKWLTWIVYALAALVVISALTVLGGKTGVWFAERWEKAQGLKQDWVTIGPPGVHIAALQVYQPDVGPYPEPFVVLLRTDDGRLLCSGILQDEVPTWNWFDISNSFAWDDFPEVRLAHLVEQESTPEAVQTSYFLWLALGEGAYQVGCDQTGQWQPTDKHPPAQNNRADEEWDYMENYAWRDPPGVIRQIQRVFVGYWEGPTTFAFSLLEDSDEVWLFKMASPGVWLAGVYVVYVLCGASVGLFIGIIAAVGLAVVLPKGGYTRK